MRFRVPNNGGQQAADGVGNFFRSLAMAPMAEAQAAQSAQEAEQKRALMGAQTGLANASIGRTMAEAAIKEQEAKQLAVRPDMIKLMSASKAGVSVPDLNNAISERTHGAPEMGPAFLSAPIEGVGPSGRTAQFDDVISNLFAPAMAQGQAHTNFDQLSKARGEYQDQGIRGRAVEAATSGNHELAGALASVLGNKAYEPFAAVGNTGTAINKVTGAQPVVNPALNFLFDKEGRALIGQRDASAKASNASAASSYASAGQHRAATDKLRMEISQGGSTGQVQIVPGADGSVMLVDKRTGQARPAVGPDGAPVQGKGPPLKAMPGSAAKGHLDNLTNLRQAETALALAQGQTVDGQEGDVAATGAKGLVPNTLLNVLDGKGVVTRAAIADLGSLLIHDRSGAAVTAAEFPRLAPFVPRATDDAETVQKKLQKFVNNYRATIEESAEFYREMGYTVPDRSNRGRKAPAASAPAKPDRGSGATGSWGEPSGPAPGLVQDGFRFKGGDPSQPANWEPVR